MYIHAVHPQGSVFLRQLRFEYFMCAKILFMRFVYVAFEKNKLRNFIWNGGLLCKLGTFRPISNFRNFYQNKNSLELLNIIFENSSSKGSFGANKKKVEFLLLSPDCWKLLTTSLNNIPGLPEISIRGKMQCNLPPQTLQMNNIYAENPYSHGQIQSWECDPSSGYVCSDLHIVYCVDWYRTETWDSLLFTG